MPRPLSQLTYTRIQEPPSEAMRHVPTVVTLHGHRQRGNSLAEYARAAAPTGRLLGLESYKGVFVGREIVGYTWFLGPDSAPAPVFYGDALAEVERFLWDEVDRQGSDAPVLPFLLGVDQGAIVALAAAAAVPDLLSGVIAIDGSFPLVPGWEPPLAPLDGLPILLIDRGATPPTSGTVLAGDALVDRLTAWGSRVTSRDVPPADTIPQAVMQDWLADQPIRTRTGS